MSNGKGSRPRNCFTKDFRDNYDSINWGSKKQPVKKPKKKSTKLP